VNGAPVDGKLRAQPHRSTGLQDVDLAIFRTFKLRESSACRPGRGMNVHGQPECTQRHSSGHTTTVSTFGQITKRSVMRQLQLGVRLIF